MTCRRACAVRLGVRLEPADEAFEDRFEERPGAAAEYPPANGVRPAPQSELWLFGSALNALHGQRFYPGMQRVPGLLFMRRIRRVHHEGRRGARRPLLRHMLKLVM